TCALPISFLGNSFLWPSWEIKTIDKTIREAVVANRRYLEEIARFYNVKGELSTDYKLSRKAAFLALSDLNSSFQRMTQEPKTQHKNLGKIYQMVMLMQSFLASLASLGTYITHNETTPASGGFNKVIGEIKGYLELSEAMLRNTKPIEQLNLKNKKEKSLLDGEYGRD